MPQLYHTFLADRMEWNGISINFPTSTNEINLGMLTTTAAVVKEATMWALIGAKGRRFYTLLGESRRAFGVVRASMRARGHPNN